MLFAPQSDQRSDFVPARGGDFVLPDGQDFVREADFVPQYSKHYPTSKPWEAKSSIFCKIEKVSAQLRCAGRGYEISPWTGLREFPPEVERISAAQREFRLSARYYTPAQLQLRTSFHYFVPPTSNLVLPDATLLIAPRYSQNARACRFQ